MNNVISTKAFAVVVALLIGIVGGSASAGEKIKMKTIEVEKAVEVPVEKIVDREVRVEVVPGVCLEAIELGAGIGRSVDAILDHHGQFLGAILDDNLSMMERLNAKGPGMYAEANSGIAEFNRAARTCESIGAGVRAEAAA